MWHSMTGRGGKVMPLGRSSPTTSKYSQHYPDVSISFKDIEGYYRYLTQSKRSNPDFMEFLDKEAMTLMDFQCNFRDSFKRKSRSSFRQYLMNAKSLDILKQDYGLGYCLGKPSPAVLLPIPDSPTTSADEDDDTTERALFRANNNNTDKPDPLEDDAEIIKLFSSPPKKKKKRKSKSKNKPDNLTQDVNEICDSEPTTTSATTVANEIPAPSEKALSRANFSETQVMDTSASVTDISENQTDISSEMPVQISETTTDEKPTETTVVLPTESVKPNPATNASEPVKASVKIVKKVIRGLSIDTSVEDIKTELSALKFKINCAFQMKKRVKESIYRPLPLFVITLPDSQENKDFMNISKLLGFDIKIERLKGGRGPPQCHNCQMYGHIRAQCSNSPKCMKCAGPHYSVQCTMPRSSTPKCSNCAGPHTANYSGCAVKPRPNFTRNSKTKIQRLNFALKELKFLLQDEEVRPLVEKIMME